MMLSTKEAAAELGVPLGTLKRWVDELPVPLERDAAGARRFGPEALEVLREVHKLRQQERHFDSIRVIIGPIQNDGEPGPGSGQRESQPEGQLADHDLSQAVGPSQPDPGPGLDRAQPGPTLEEVATTVGDAIAERMAGELVEVLRRETDLAEKYARAAHRIGELEATTRGLEADRDRLAGELAEAKAERDQARALLAAPPRPWWKVWG